MTTMPSVGALALPMLSPDVPMQFAVEGTGAGALTVPLTIALLEGGVISDAMLRTPRNALLTEVFGETEKQLAERALSHWWTKVIREHSCKFFRWSLQVQQQEYQVDDYDTATTAWFCFSRMEGELPRFALARGIERLENTCEGFGQTVLAVLREATRLLPDSFNPWHALWMAEYMYWRDSEDDELIRITADENETTVQDVIQNHDVMTRAKFFADMPSWVCAPQQMLSREAIEAVGAGLFERRVIEVCDALHALVSQPDFVLRPEDKGAYRLQRDTIDASMILLWKESDTIGQVIDDYLDDLGNSGEYCEFIDANPVTMTAEGIREFQELTEQALQVAVLTEKLVLLLGDRF